MWVVLASIYIQHKQHCTSVKIKEKKTNIHINCTITHNTIIYIPVWNILSSVTMQTLYNDTYTLGNVVKEYENAMVKYLIIFQTKYILMFEKGSL